MFHLISEAAAAIAKTAPRLIYYLISRDSSID